MPSISTAVVTPNKSYKKEYPQYIRNYVFSRLNTKSINNPIKNGGIYEQTKKIYRDQIST